MLEKSNRVILVLAGVLFALAAPKAQGNPQILWDNPSGPWASGPAGTRNWSGGGLVEQTAIVNSFVLEGTDQPCELSWTFWASGWAISPSGNPWEHARLELNGLGWIEEGEVNLDPWDVTRATQVWGQFERFGPPPGPDIWFSGAFGPVHTRLVVQPGVRYALKQWNFSKLNFFDLGYFNAELSSEIALVPEPFTLTLLGLSLIGAGSYRRLKKGR